MSIIGTKCIDMFPYLSLLTLSEHFAKSIIRIILDCFQFSRNI